MLQSLGDTLAQSADIGAEENADVGAEVNTDIGAEDTWYCTINL